MFKGIQKVSLVDYPGVVCATLFTGGCNFRCPWCHNMELVDEKQVHAMADIPEEMVQKFLLSRLGKIQGVCITGGEPTLWGEKLSRFMIWCKDNGFLVKLDTNGYLPFILENFIQRKLVDFIAMDLKNIFGKYSETAGFPRMEVSRIRKSVDIIRKSGIPHQFRTTVVPEMVIEDEIREFYDYLKEPIVFQEYRDPSLKPEEETAASR